MGKFNNIQHVFFDLDHTLWDFERNSAATFISIFQELNFNFSVETFLSYYNPINHYYWKLYREDQISEIELRHSRLEKTFAKMKISLDRKQIEKISELYIQQLSSHTFLFQDTKSVLEYLYPKYKLHIITNGFENVQQRKLKNSGIANFFQTVFTAEKYGVKKPHPNIFFSAMQSSQAKPENSLMIGDNLEADIRGALNLGMYAIHFNSHNEEIHKESLIINSLKELKTLL